MSWVSQPLRSAVFNPGRVWRAGVGTQPGLHVPAPRGMLAPWAIGQVALAFTDQDRAAHPAA